MYDILANNIENPLLYFIDVECFEDFIKPRLIYVSMGLRPNYSPVLLDKRGDAVCRVELPVMLSGLPCDVASAFTKHLRVKEWLLQ